LIILQLTAVLINQQIIAQHTDSKEAEKQAELKMDSIEK
jgi:hypothetical protein